MTGKQIKSLIGIYAASMNIMGILIPVSILAAVAQAFPDVPMAMVQMIVSIPSILAIASNFIFAGLSHKLYRKTSIIISTCIFIVGGILPYFFHDNFAWLIVAACCSGFAMGGVQNGTGALVTDEFEGDLRGTAFGLFSVFVGIGGILFTMVAANLGAQQWYNAYLAYLVMVPMLILELICMPKGNKEAKPTKGNHIKVPKEVLAIGAIGFFYFALTQLFNSNEAMLIAERGLGGTVEAGNAASLYNIAGMIGGFLVFPWKKIFKKHTLSVNTVISTAGCAAMLIASSMLHVSAGAILMSLAYSIYNPIECQFASEASEPMGMAFNLAIITATQSLGQAFSPMIMGAAAVPFGGGITGQFTAGVIMVAILAVVTFWYFGKVYKPTKPATSEAVAE